MDNATLVDLFVNSGLIGRDELPLILGANRNNPEESITGEIRELIRQPGASEGKIREAARRSRLETILDDGIEKVKMGVTSLEELERVVLFEEVPPTEIPSTCPSCAKNVEKDWKSCPFCGYILGGGAAALPPLKKGARASAPPAPKEAEHFKIMLVDDADTLKSLVMHLLQKKFSVRNRFRPMSCCSAFEPF